MGKIPMIIPVTDLRQDAAAALEKAREAGEPIVITQRGRAAAVMMSVEAYERTEAERRLLVQLLCGGLERTLGPGADPEDAVAEVDRLIAELEAGDLTPVQRSELRERLAEYRADPRRVSSWDDVKSRLRSRS